MALKTVHRPAMASVDFEPVTPVDIAACIAEGLLLISVLNGV